MSISIAELRKTTPSHVKILAVSKGRSADAIRKLYAEGQRDFGENYVNELKEKRSQLADCPEIRWHFIGRIQSNKAKDIANCHLVHSLCEFRHAEKLAQYLNNRKLPVLVEVNLGGESQKGGVSPANLVALCKSLLSLPKIQLLGLMTILPQNANRRPLEWFKELAHLRDRVQSELNCSLPELSMGMSDDYEEAILAGATWIRIGRALFESNKPLGGKI